MNERLTSRERNILRRMASGDVFWANGATPRATLKEINALREKIPHAWIQTERPIHEPMLHYLMSGVTEAEVLRFIGAEEKKTKS